ncbi:hypothetical protein [Streptomyces alfalfae]|uniref:Uncharacterized protein n=1 Tax=Streptomyces alfalfae TaxID=1642299 RepID=A0A7T4TY76_9ACTN|nr:hypothetical protein [Streptomyces alfalfae]QQC89027.1 hypothetical protein I8755_11790 [Streptomyces alfalfae]
MSTLPRAKKECGSWFWDLDETAPSGLDSALSVAARMVEVLDQFELLSPRGLECMWLALGKGFTGVMSTVFIQSLVDPEIPHKLHGSRPAALPEAKFRDFKVIGSGVWYDAEGRPHREPRLVDVSVTTSSYGPTATVSAHHDIWSWFDFSGRPHPEVQSRNAPRLADALLGINSALGVEAETGEPTYFGHAVEFGISTPDADEHGLGPDLTDKL